MDHDESKLIALAVNGDLVAAQILLVQHHAALMGDIRQRIPAQLAAQVSAEDVCQETYIAAIRKLGDFRAAHEGGFFAWLQTIAEHKLTDAIRSVGAAKRGGGRQVAEPVGGEAASIVGFLELLAVDQHTPSQSLARREVVQHVQEALDRLESDYREVLRLRFMKGLSVEQVAQQMARTDGAVKMLCSRALKQLCEQMGDLSRFTSQSVEVRRDKRGE